MEVARINLRTAVKQGLSVRHGNEFQSTVHDILRHTVDGFTPIEPYGREGDGGNDGYSKTLGLYVQTYAPVSTKASLKAAVRKAVADFGKIKRKWVSIKPIDEYWFVMNSPGSNIPVETALEQIARKHRVKTRFVGTADLTEEALKLDRRVLEALLGFTVGNENGLGGDGCNPHDPLLDSLTAIDAPRLAALHLVAAIAYPVSPAFYKLLFPKLLKWDAFFLWVDSKGWLARHGGLACVNDVVIAACDRNEAACRQAREALIPKLLKRESVIFRYLAIKPLIEQGRLHDAVKVVSDVGTQHAGRGWDDALLKIFDVLNREQILKLLSPSELAYFELAHANLLAISGRETDAFNTLKKALEKRSTWPKRLNRQSLLLTFGVCAHRAGDDRLAGTLYAEAVTHAREMRDDWILGRAATNLAQLELSTNRDRANELLDEAERAKRKCGDKVGLVIVAMVRGLGSVEHGEPVEGLCHFEMAESLLSKAFDADVACDVSFNLGKCYGELGRWSDAVRKYRRSAHLARSDVDDFRRLRATNGLSEAYFRLGKWQLCERQCQILAALPSDTPHPEFRLAGMHGLIVLDLQADRQETILDRVSGALEYAREHGQQDWIVRLVRDTSLRASGRQPDREALRSIRREADTERFDGRIHSAVQLYREVWAICLQANRWCDIEKSANRIVSRLIKEQNDPLMSLDHLKWKFGVLRRFGHLDRAASCLNVAADIAERHEWWTDYCAVVDELAVLHDVLDQPEIAIPLHKHAIRTAAKHRLGEQVRRSTSNLAEALRRAGRFRSALKISERALALHDVDENPPDFISCLHNHALIQKALQVDSALRTLRRCERLAKKHSLVREQVKATMARADIAWDQTLYSTAETLYRRALSTCVEDDLFSAAADCSYNLAILVRRRGDAAGALRLLERAPEDPSEPVHGFHRRTLKAQLLEDVLCVPQAKEEWLGAAALVERIGDTRQTTYCNARALLLSHDPATAKAVADSADKVLAAIYDARDVDADLQRRFDAASKFAIAHGLVVYEVRAFQAACELLTEAGGTKNLNRAAEASVASVLVSFKEQSSAMTSSAMSKHVRWLMDLEPTHRQVERLRTIAARWLQKTLPTVFYNQWSDTLLMGFDTMTKEIKRRTTGTRKGVARAIESADSELLAL